MKESGFIGRESYRMEFSDLPEVLFASILTRKITDIHESRSITIELSLHDLFPQYGSLQEIERAIAGKRAIRRDRNTEYFTDVINFLFKTDYEPHEKEIDLLHFFNSYIERRLHFLAKGDNLELKKCVEDYEVNDSQPLHSFRVTLVPSSFIPIHSKNLFDSLAYKEKLYVQFKDKVENIGWGMSYQKQIENALDYFSKRQSQTGENKFDFDLREITFRHLLQYAEDKDERLTLPAPLANNTSERLSIPFYLELTGHLDIEGFKISSPIEDIGNIEVVFSVAKPAIRNRFLAKSFGLTADQRRSLSETQIEIYERVYRTLFERGSFIARPGIESSFCKFFYWVLKKITYCLEEPSFLKERAERWLGEHGDAKYTQMEDNFFLPFLYEKLRDEFGELSIKKPERFGGEIDLLFADLPIELKVRKNDTESLIDIIDSNYKPASQAATYAAVTRLGFVAVLDMPRNEKKVTNLDSCVKVIEKQFSENSLNTQIIVCIFYCNLPRPSAAT